MDYYLKDIINLLKDIRNLLMKIDDDNRNNNRELERIKEEVREIKRKQR